MPMSPKAHPAALGTLERGFSTSAADLNALVDDDGIDMSQFEGGGHTTLDRQAGQKHGRVNTSDSAQDQVAAEHRVKQRNDNLRKKLAMMQVLLEDKTTKIKAFSTKYLASHNHREIHRPQPFENNLSDDDGGSSGDGVALPGIPGMQSLGDVGGADAIPRPSVTGRKFRRKGSVKTQTIVQGIKAASQELKERLYELPRFTHREIEKIKAAAQPKLLNGMLSKANFQRMMSKVARVKVKNPTKYTAVIFDLLDLSSIGFIRMKDFKFMLAIFCDGSPGLRLRELFLSFDTDGDGHLNAPELTQLVTMINALRPTSYSGALDDEQVSDMLMMELDIDGDGEISLEEFVYQSQGNDSITDVFLGVVDGFHKAEAGRRKRASISSIMSTLEEGEAGTIDEHGVARFRPSLQRSEEEEEPEEEEDDDDDLTGFMTVDTSTSVSQAYKCIHKTDVYMRTAPRSDTKTGQSVPPGGLVHSTGTCIGEKGIKYLEFASPDYGSGYYPMKHPKTGKAMFEATGATARPSRGRDDGGGAGVFGEEPESDDEDEDTVFGFG